MTLQDDVFSRHPDIIYCGWPPRESMPDVHDAILLEGQYVTAKAMARAQAEARAKFHSPDCKVLFSREHLTDLTRDKGIIIERLKSVFGDIRVILMIREQISALESMYLWNLRQLGIPGRAVPERSFDAFLEKEMSDWRGLVTQSWLTTYDYGSYARHYVDVLGKANVGIFLFEDMVRTPKKFLSDLLQFIGVDSAAVDSRLHLGKKNVRLTTWEYRYWMALTYFTPYPVNRAIQLAMPRWVSGLLKRGPPMKAQLSHKWRSNLSAIYAPGNRYLVEQFGLPLESHGYATVD